MRKLILITGASGQLGEAMTAQLQAQHELVAVSRAELDVADAYAVVEKVATICPDVIVNCAAYTDVDGAQKNPTAALDANAWAVRALARAAEEINAVLVHYSTDFVFGGDATRPYTEEDEPNPRSAYAVSKLVGEWFAQATPQHYVLRVESLFGGPRAKSSVDKILQNLIAGREVRAFVDRTVTPSYVEDVVRATTALIERRSPFGVYHCVNSGWTTWSGIAHELAGILGKPDARIIDVPVADVPMLAPRPQYAALSNAKLAAAGIEMPTWQDALRRYVAGIT